MHTLPWSLILYNDINVTWDSIRPIQVSVLRLVKTGFTFATSDNMLDSCSCAFLETFELKAKETLSKYDQIIIWCPPLQLLREQPRGRVPPVEDPGPEQIMPVVINTSMYCI